MSTSIAYSNVFKTWKKSKKKEHMDNQKAKLQNRKKTGSKINGKKGTSKRVKNGEKMDLSICIFVVFFCFFDLHFCCFFFCFFLAFAWKKQKNSKIKAPQKQKNKSKKQKKQQKCKWTSPCFSHFFPFLSFLFVSFFSLLFCFCVFLDFADLLFGFSIFLHFSRFFSSFKT